MIEGRVDIPPLRAITFKNVSGETIPAFGLIRPTGEDADGYLQGHKSNADGGLAFINGPVDVPDQKHGLCTRDTPYPAIYDSADGTPAIGETWGAGNGSFKLRKGKSGFTVSGTAADGRVQVVVAGGGGGQIAVKETDGTPTVDPCDTIRFDSANFVVTDEGSGDAKVNTKGVTQSIEVVVGCDEGEIVTSTLNFTNGLLTSVT